MDIDYTDVERLVELHKKIRGKKRLEFGDPDVREFRRLVDSYSRIDINRLAVEITKMDEVYEKEILGCEKEIKRYENDMNGIKKKIKSLGEKRDNIRAFSKVIGIHQENEDYQLFS